MLELYRTTTTTKTPWFPMVSDYGLIGNGRTAALVSKFGVIEWLCLPHFDSRPYFATILDRKKGGHFSIQPTKTFSSRQFYLPDSNVLATEFTTASGKILIRDCFSATSEENKKNILWPETEILRCIEGVEGDVEIFVSFEPKVEFGEKTIKLENRQAFGLAAHIGSRLLSLQSTLPSSTWKLNKSSSRAFIKTVISSGEQETFSLTFSETAPAVIPALGKDSENRFQLTHKYWTDWLSKCRYEGPYKEEVKRSALALKLMLFAPSGAIVAAPTTSLPEDLSGERNWDYRYCWLRDAAFTVRALTELDYHDEARAFSSWMLHATRLSRPRLQVLYNIFGHTNLNERVLPDISGYRGSKPVRFGNAAHDQFQLDVYGEVLDALSIILPKMGPIDNETQKFIIGLGKIVCDEWNRTDDGIWEVRSGHKHHTHSKVMAWVALDRLIKICQHFRWQAPVDQFHVTQKQIQNTIEVHGFNKDLGAYTQTFGGDKLDASLLVLPLVGYCSPTSPKMQGTIEAIERELVVGDLVYRYRGVDDGIATSESAFGLCSLWYIECLAKSGRLQKAQALFRSFIERQNEIGLWSEEIDPRSGEFLGNYPQAFTHVGLINCAITLFQGANS